MNMDWSARSHGKTTESLRGVWSEKNGAWFVGGAGVLLRYDSAAMMNPWSVEVSGTKVALTGFWASDRDLWMVGEGGAILRRLR